VAQELVINLGLGQSQTGLALRAQLYDTAGATVGGLISAGFTEFGRGTYQFYHAAYSDAFAAAGGSVVFTVSGAPTVPLASVGLNPADFGLTDAASATAIATAVWASGTRTLTSFGTLVADTAAAVWAYATRTLTQTLASLVDAASGNTISRRRGDLWTISVTGLGNISTRTKLWFTVKESDNDPDTASILQIVEGTGLVYLNGAAGTAGHGSVVVTDTVTGALTITVQEDATAALELASNLYYDIQWLHSGGTATPVDGTFKVTRDATRSIT
jgi:hypothetical protein